MGFFSLKQICSVCEKECGLNRFQLDNKEWVCYKCFKAAGLTLTKPFFTMSAIDIKNAIYKKKIKRISGK